MRKAETYDFASAAMMRLVAAGLAQQGIASGLRSPGGAHVARHDKQSALAAILEIHGRKAVLCIADALPTMPPEPVLQALTRAVDVPDLLARWHRLEAFSHGRHVVMAEPVCPSAIRLTHRARDAGPAPSEPETLLVLAVLARLAEMVLSNPVTLADPTGGIWRAGGTWHDPGPIEAGGGVILRYAEQVIAEPPVPAGLADALVADLRERLTGDPLRRWTLAEIAEGAGLSPRTLQRRLADQGLSLSRLVSDARLQVAAEFLTDGNGPGLSEIGFLAGFSDQAHFTRAFTKGVGTSPRRYREHFSGSSPMRS